MNCTNTFWTAALSRTVLYASKWNDLIEYHWTAHIWICSDQQLNFLSIECASYAPSTTSEHIEWRATWWQHATLLMFIEREKVPGQRQDERKCHRKVDYMPQAGAKIHYSWTLAHWQCMCLPVINVNRLNGFIHFRLSIDSRSHALVHSLCDPSSTWSLSSCPPLHNSYMYSSYNPIQIFWCDDDAMHSFNTILEPDLFAFNYQFLLFHKCPSSFTCCLCMMLVYGAWMR